MNQYIIENNFNLKVSDIQLLDKHFGTELYLINTDIGKYIVKVLPLYMENVKNEGELTEYLYNHGLKVARFMKSKEDTYVVKTPEYQFTVQQFIEGESLSVNTAPDWFISKSADFLGQTALLLKDYEGLSLRFGKDFFSTRTVHRKLCQYKKELAKAKKLKNVDIIPVWEEQIRHLKRFSKFHIKAKKLTYANSHGDYHIGQAIIHNNDFTVVDWSSACILPVCLDVITSYVFSSSTCAEGEIDADGLKKYIQQFTEKFPLTEYDIKAMPYVLYFWHCMCNYRPDELSDIPDSYKAIAKLINNLLNWLYDNVDELSEQLKK
ncbi:MAG: phosphotransferase [Clostridia bacterium]|nr:phosphotransferase [Clostridia bacterium]